MFDGYLSLAGVELINAARTGEYLRTLVPEFPLVRVTSEYDTLQEALGDGAYTNPEADGAVWVSPDDDATKDFYGLYPLAIEGIGDSTMKATVTEGVLDGGYVNLQRDGTRSIRVRGILAAKDDLALEAGLTWLRNALPERQSAFTSVIDYATLRFFLSKPVADDDPDVLRPYDRYYHRVKTTLNVSIIKRYELNCDAAAYEVDFVLTAENPFPYSTPVTVSTGAPSLVGYYADDRTNYLTYPNAEATSIPDQVNLPASGNLIENPTFDVDASGWTAIPVGSTATLQSVPADTTNDAFGYRVGQLSFVTAPTGVGAGLYYDLFLGNIGGLGAYLAVQMNMVVTSLATRMQLSIEFYYDTSRGLRLISTVLGSEFPTTYATVGRFDAPLILGASVPDPGTAGTHAITARIKLVTVAGTGYVAQTAGSYIQVSGLRADLVASATTRPSPYYTLETTQETNLVSNPTADSVTTGYVAIPGTTGVAAVTNPASLNTFGQKLLRVTWSTASTAAGGGCYYDIAVTAGTIYSFSAAFIRASITTRLKMRVEWRTASVTISNSDGAEFVATANTIYSKTVEGVTAPATAVIARITVLSVAGTSYANWSISSTLDFFALEALANTGAFRNTGGVYVFFNGDTDHTQDWYYYWTGTPYASTSRKAAYAVKGWYQATGGTGANATSHRSMSFYYGDDIVQAASSETYWWKAPTDDADVIVGGPYLVGASSTVYPGITTGLPYEGTVWLRPSKNQRLFLSIVWLDVDNAVISTTAGSASAVSGGGSGFPYTRLSVSGTAPALATGAALYVTSTSGTGYTRWAAGDACWIDSAMIEFGNTVQDYFDGTTPDEPPYEYSWTGTVNQSSSLAEYSSATVSADIIDPDLDPFPTPPSLPVIPNDAVVAQNEYRRYSVLIDAADVALWAGVAPIVQLSADTDEARQVRLRFYPNPDSVAPSALVRDSFTIEYVISYLPADSVMTLDTVNQIAYVSVSSGDPVLTNELVYGTNGGPTVWGELTDGVDYVLTIDILPAADIANLTVDLDLVRRE